MQLSIDSKEQLTNNSRPRAIERLIERPAKHHHRQHHADLTTPNHKGSDSRQSNPINNNLHLPLRAIPQSRRSQRRNMRRRRPRMDGNGERRALGDGGREAREQGRGACCVEEWSVRCMQREVKR